MNQAPIGRITPMFDGLESSFIALNQPSALGLAHILRHKKLWPKGFKWDYLDTDKCAIGMMAHLWYHNRLPNINDIAVDLRLPLGDVYHISFSLWIKRRKIKPKHVAKAIEQAYHKANE
jgi:hypothetical protein